MREQVMTISKTFNDSYQEVIEALRLNRQATSEHAAALAAAHKKFNETEAALNVQYEKETREATLAQDNGNREIQRQMGQVETSIRRGENDFKMAHVDGRNLPSATVKVDGSKGEERAFADAVDNVGRIATALEDTRRRLERVRGEIEHKKARRRTFFRILVVVIIALVAGAGLWANDQITKQRTADSQAGALAYMASLNLAESPINCDAGNCVRVERTLGTNTVYGFYFSANTNQNITFSLSPKLAGNTIVGNIDLLDSEGNLIESRNGNLSSNLLTLSNQFTDAGTYIVLISSASNGVAGTVLFTVSKG